MADIDIRTNRSRHIELGTGTLKSLSMGGAGTPKYVGCTATVTRVENGVLIRLTDYRGVTEEIVYESIEDISFDNVEGTFTITLPDGRTFTSGSLIGPQGEQGIPGPQGERGEKGDTGDTPEIDAITNSELEEMLV